MIFSFVKNNLKAGLWRNIIVLISIIISVTLIISVFNLSRQVDNNFKENAEQYDLIVTPKGSPTQAILSSLYFYDNPIGTMPYTVFRDLSTNENITKIVPIAMGDNMSGYKIVGTTVDYFGSTMTLAEGKYFSHNFDLVLGSTVAKVLGLKIGDTIVSTHGLQDSFSDHDHDDHPFTVVGILKETKSPNDICAFTTVMSYAIMHHECDHDHGENGEHDDHEGHEDCDHDHDVISDDEIEITAILIKLNSYAAQAQLAIDINDEDIYMASNTNKVLRELYSIVDSVAQVLKIIIAIVIIMALIMMMLSMFQAVNERKKELAILRAIGANRIKILQVVLLEAFVISLIGAIGGYLLSRVLLIVAQHILGNLMGSHIVIFTMYMEEAITLIVSTLLGVLAAAIPAFVVYRMEPTMYLR